jgi:NADH:ubiquinone oxidoreductase subunit 5 (subunit L)/multisubunit Na+/H+ antiporter MnhA subunit
MNRNHKILIIIHYILLAISILALFVNDANPNKFLILGIPLWTAVITYLASLIIKFISWLKYEHLNTDNPIKTIRFYQEYFDKIGYALFTGGIITLVTTDKSVTSYGLILIGFTCMVIAGINKRRFEKFEESKKKDMNFGV